MHTLRLLSRPAVIAAFVALTAAGIVKAAAAADAGSCGEYMYWHDGKCVDARDKPASEWPDSMAAKKALW